MFYSAYSVAKTLSLQLIFRGLILRKHLHLRLLKLSQYGGSPCFRPWLDSTWIRLCTDKEASTVGFFITGVRLDDIAIRVQAWLDIKSP